MMLAYSSGQWSAFWAMIAAVVAVAAAVLSGLSWWANRSMARTNEAMARANEQLVQIEADRRAEELAERAAAVEARRHADMRLKFLHVADYEVIAQLFNVGQGEARDVRVEMVATIGEGDLPHPSHDRVIRSIDGQTGETITLADVSMGDAAAFECRVSWVDDDGPHETRQEIHWA